MKRPVFRQKKLVPETDSDGSIAFSGEEGLKTAVVFAGVGEAG
jgi:hypothetical protein